MTENERKAIDTLQDMIAEGQYNGADIVARDDEEELKIAIQVLEEIQAYRALEQRLQSVYGEHDGLLEIVVNGLAQYENAPDKAIKAVLLTDSDVEKWEQYRAIGTIEEFKALKEKRTAKSRIIVAGKYFCPECGITADMGYCKNCGQKLY